MTDTAEICRLCPGAQLNIKRKSFVLIEDLVADRLPDIKDLIPLVYQQHGVIFCSLKNLRNLRTDFPTLPVYGIWQLIFSSCDDFVKDLYAVYFDEKRQNGQFLLKMNGRFISGRITHGHAADLSFDLDLQDAELIELKLSELCLPPQSVLTPNEQGQIERHRKRRMMIAAVSGVCAVAMSFALVFHVEDERQRQFNIEKQALLNELDVLASKRDALVAGRVLRWPNQWQVLYPLARLAYEGIRFNVWGVSLDQPVLRARLLADTDSERAWVPEWMYSLPELDLDYQMDGSIQISWANYTGVAE